MFDSICLQEECLKYQDEDKPTFSDLFHGGDSQEPLDFDFGVNPVLNEFNQYIEFSGIEEVKMQSLQENKNISIQHPEKKSAKLDYHNFQKHLVLCLKRIMKSEAFKHTEGQSLSYKLWRAFCNSTKMTKELMSLTFGSQEDCKKINLKKYGFDGIYESHSQEDLKIARTKIEIEILYEMKSIELNELIEQRRIKQKQNFKSYLLAFVKGLEEGTFFKRLPSLKRKQKKDRH